MDPNTIIKSYYDNGKSLEKMAEELGGGIITINVEGPNGEDFCGRYATVGDTIFLNIAQTAGFEFIDDFIDISTTTRGIGEMILDGLNRGYRNYILELNNHMADDLGIVMLKKLGYDFIDDNGNSTYKFRDIKKIEYDKVDPRLQDTNIKMICNDTYGGGLSTSIERYLNGKYV